MSGGVDSSVAAALLQRDHDVIGCFMRLGSPGETLDEPMLETATTCKPTKIGKQGCCSINDAADARLVAAQLNIPFYVCNFKKDFGRIMDYFAAEYAVGRTPNPCVRCNDWLKFGKLHEYAQQLDCDFVASGHYARVVNGADGTRSLMRGVDLDKDQSYVLFGVPREKLGQMLLPIGGMKKSAVREVAKELGLPVFDKPDSQEICFVPDNDYAGFLERRDPELAKPGEFVDLDGKTVGTHQGQHRFTLGQRRGVGLALGYPIYVVGKDPASNTVTVGPRESLLADACTVGEANWLVEHAEVQFAEWTACWAQHRYNAEPVAAEVRAVEPLSANAAVTHSGRRGRFEVRFREMQDAVTPGQALVVYGDVGNGDGGPERVLGGGWIESVQSKR